MKRVITKTFASRKAGICRSSKNCKNILNNSVSVRIFRLVDLNPAFL